MVRFGSLRWCMRISRTSTCAIVEEVRIVAIGPTICEGSIVFRCSDLLLVAFRRRLLDSSIAGIELFPPIPLSLDRTLRIEWPGLAVPAEVFNFPEDILVGDDAMLIDVVAFGVLPGFAWVAEHRISIVIVEAADAFDGVVFYLFSRYSCGILTRCRLDGRGYRAGNRPRERRSVRGERKGIGHTMAKNVPLLYECNDGVVRIRGLNRMTRLYGSVRE